MLNGRQKMSRGTLRERMEISDKERVKKRKYRSKGKQGWRYVPGYWMAPVTSVGYGVLPSIIGEARGGEVGAAIIRLQQFQCRASGFVGTLDRSFAEQFTRALESVYREAA